MWPHNTWRKASSWHILTFSKLANHPVSGQLAPLTLTGLRHWCQQGLWDLQMSDPDVPMLLSPPAVKEKKHQNLKNLGPHGHVDDPTKNGRSKTEYVTWSLVLHAGTSQGIPVCSLIYISSWSCLRNGCHMVSQCQVVPWFCQLSQSWIPEQPPGLHGLLRFPHNLHFISSDLSCSTLYWNELQHSLGSTQDCSVEIKQGWCLPEDFWFESSSVQKVFACLGWPGGWEDIIQNHPKSSRWVILPKCPNPNPSILVDRSKNHSLFPSGPVSWATPQQQMPLDFLPFFDLTSRHRKFMDFRYDL